MARAADHGEEVLTVELTPAALQAAHRPYSHGRDDDVRLVVRELDRSLAGLG